jgi:hypothetical protein
VGDEWFVPLAPIAAALGATLDASPGSQGLRVVRRDGVIVDYDSGSGRFRQGNMLIGDLRDFRQVQLAGPLETFLFPLSGTVILLGVTVREDPLDNVLEIDSLESSDSSNPSGPRFQASKLDYLYSLAASGQELGQSLNLRGEALLGMDRISGTLALNQAPGSSVPQFPQGSVRIDMPGHRTFLLGDQGSYTGVDALSNAVRGLGYEQPLGSFQAEFQAGFAASAVTAALASPGVAIYDTDFAGLSLRRIFKTADKERRPDLSFAGSVFRGPSREGGTFGAAYSDLLLANQFKVQALFGSFSGESDREILAPVIPGVASPGTAADPTDSSAVPEVLASQSIHVQGIGYGFSVSDSSNPFHNKWILMGSLEVYSPNFLTVMANSRFSAVKRRSASTAVQPFRYLSFSGGIGGSLYTLGNPDKTLSYNYGANASLPAGVPFQLGYFRTIETNAGTSASRFDLSQYSLQLPHLGRFGVGGSFSEFQFNGRAGRLANGTFSANTEKWGRLGFHYQSQLSSNTNAGVDWSGEFGKKKSGHLRVGVDRETARGQTTIFAPVVTLRLPPVRGQVLNFSYIGMRGLSMLQFTLGGSLLNHREMLPVDGISAMLVEASLSGQVYWDANGNGKYDAAVDHPLSQLRVTLDGDHTAVTDSFGYFRFDHVNPGTHRIRAAIDTVPARLVFVDGEEHLAAVVPYRENRQDFRAAEAGQIRGRVMTAQEGFFEKEPPLKAVPDAHVLTSRDRESFAEGDGSFVLADLAPGSYVVHLDPASIPRGLVPTPAFRTFVVKPGQTVAGADFRLERSVIVKPLPPAEPHTGHEKESAVTAPASRTAFANSNKAPLASAADKWNLPDYALLTTTASVSVAAHQGQETPVAKVRSEIIQTERPSPKTVGPKVDTSTLSAPSPPSAIITAPATSPVAAPSPGGQVVTVARPEDPLIDQVAAQRSNQIGRQLTLAGRYQEAIVELDRAITLAPGFALAYNARGYAWFLLRKYSRAIDDLTAAIRLHPKYSNAYLIRGMARKASGDLPGAGEDLRRAQELTR